MIELQLSIHTKRKAILEDVVRLTPSIATCSRENFRTYLKLVFGEAGLDDRKIAENLGYNVTSVRRWQSGDSCPHRALWKPIQSWITEEAQSLIAELETKIAAESESFSEAASNVVPLKRAAPSLENTRPAQFWSDRLAAFAADEINLASNGSCQVDLADESGLGAVKLRIRRRNDDMFVRKEGPGQAPLVRTSPHEEELSEMPEGAWLSVKPSTWRIDAKSIGRIFRWPAT